MTRIPTSHVVFSKSGGNGAIVSLATTLQRRHNDVISLEGVGCSAGESPVCRVPHLLATCQWQFHGTTPWMSCSNDPNKTPTHQHSCTPAPSTSRVDVACVLLVARAFVFGLFLFFVLDLLLFASSPNYFPFHPRFTAVTDWGGGAACAESTLWWCRWHLHQARALVFGLILIVLHSLVDARHLTKSFFVLPFAAVAY